MAGRITAHFISASIMIALTASAIAQSAAPVRPPERVEWPVITNDNYPPEALRLREQGLVGVTYTISEKGRVEACTIVQSSGSKSLDEASCALIIKRARYRAARDAEGKAVPAEARLMMAWTLPTN